MTGLFRGVACNKCNLKLKLSRKIPVIFHNLRGYDSHLLLEKLGKFKKPINIIPNNMEKYMMFSVGSEIKYFDKKIGVEKTSVIHRLTFIDSLQFMPSSLSSLVDNLKSSGLDKFKYLNQEFKSDLEILTRKGIYPYNFLDDWTKFDVECKDLKIEDFKNDLTDEKNWKSSSDIFSSVKSFFEDFKNDLTDENISEEDFQFFSNTYQQLNIKTLGEYHDLYLKTDVLLLADVFENFRKMCKDYYGLDCCNNISAPGLAWQALLKMTGQSLELISDIDQYLFIEKGLRGGISVITHRHSVANNKYLESFDKDKESKYINLLDMNNLYGKSMNEYLPVGGFNWTNPKDFRSEDVREDSDIGHFLEVDLEYPKELHDLHSDYPYCPEQVVVRDDMLSDYCKMLSSK